MAIHEKQGLSGRLTIELRTPDGRVIERRRHDNLITTAGRTLVAQLFAGEVSGKPELLIAIGDGTDTAQPGDTQLGNWVDQIPAATREIRLETEDGAQQAVVGVVATLPALAAGDKSQVLREAGILIRFPNQAPVMYNRVNFADITRTGNLEMTLAWEVLF